MKNFILTTATVLFAATGLHAAQRPYEYSGPLNGMSTKNGTILSRVVVGQLRKHDFDPACKVEMTAFDFTGVAEVSDCPNGTEIRLSVRPTASGIALAANSCSEEREYWHPRSLAGWKNVAGNCHISDGENILLLHLDIQSRKPALAGK